MAKSINFRDLNEFKKNPKELLKSLPGRGRTHIPPIPKEYYKYEWAVYATDTILQQALNDYINQKQEGENREDFYSGEKIDLYIIPPEGVDFAKEKIRNLGLEKSKKNFILRKKLRPKTSVFRLHLWK